MKGALEAAFPKAIRGSAARVAGALPAAEQGPEGGFAVSVGGESLAIPYRIYHPVLPSRIEDSLSGTERAILACLFTRHHDGRVRQRYLGRVVDRAEPWVAPFVVQLIGEYVVEIVVDIREGLGDLDVAGSAQRRQYGEFVRSNAAFVGLTAQRVVSYWNEYYRDRYPTRDEYPGSTLMAALGRAAAELT